MDLIGQRVKHGKYGEGVIMAQDDVYIRVRFAAVSEEKVFGYPLCFGTFLTLDNADAASAMKAAAIKAEKLKADNDAEASRKAEAWINERRFEQRKKQPSGSKGPVAVQPFSSVNSFCEQYEKTLSAEIAYLLTHGGKRQRIYEGRLIESKNDRFLYSFEADSELHYPDGTLITMWINMKGIPAAIVNCEDFTVVIASSVPLGGEVLSIEFSAEPWRLIKALSERLSTIREMPPSPIMKSLICDGHKSIQYDKPIAKGHRHALELSERNPITFIWGPPGTGKTETLAKIALEHIRKGHRVLMLSYSNVSVDGAIWRVFGLDKSKKPGKLIRYGYPRDKKLLQHEYLTSYNYVIHKYPTLLKERDALNTEKKHLSRNMPRYVEVSTRLTQIRNLLQDEEKTAVRKAAFVATTVSKAIVDKEIYSGRFDVVVFDEASMAFIPQIVFSASLASEHFICIGDFAQLPPIVQSDKQSILNADIFQYCGITSAVEMGHGHAWLCMLDIQYRMHPSIAGFASTNMYRSLLRSADNMGKDRESIAAASPLPGQALGLVDLSGMMSVCSQTSDASRINPLSAFIAIGLALQTDATHQVGVITPYNAQSRLLHAMSRDIAERCPERVPITCATVHQFQGSEKDIIIYDAVDCYLQKYPGTLLTSMANNLANRLFNVALTRARGKFTAIANVAYMENKGLSSALMFAKLIKKCKNSDGYRNGETLGIDLPGHDLPGYRWYNTQLAETMFLQDALQAKADIRIDIPGELGCSASFASKLGEVLTNFRSRGGKTMIRAASKNALPTCLRPFAIENTYIVNPVALIDKQITWFGVPLSKANFISEGRMLQTRFRPMIRFIGKHTANALFGFLEMNRTVDQAKVCVNDANYQDSATFAGYVLTRCRCKKCGRPMKLIKSKGRFFLGCSNYPACKTTEWITVDLVEEYFSSLGHLAKLCPQDHTTLEAKLGQYGVYVQCCGVAQHKFKLDEI